MASTGQRKRYNFNVIYNRTYGRNDTVSAFVEYIVQELENKSGRDGNALQGYFADRDMLPGRNLFDENFRVIKNSEFTIVVLDKGFITNAWSMYWNQASFRELIEQGPGSNGSQRFIPISLNLEPETIDRKCNHLKCNEVIYFKDDYQLDERNKWRLVRVIRDGLKMNDDEIRYIPEILENRGPSNEKPTSNDTGDIAVGPGFPLRPYGDVGPRIQQTQESGTQSINMASFDTVDYRSGGEKSFNVQYGNQDSIRKENRSLKPDSLQAPVEHECSQAVEHESLPRTDSDSSESESSGEDKEEGCPEAENKEEGCPETELTSITPLPSDAEARFGSMVRSGGRTDENSRLSSKAKIKAYTNQETTLNGQHRSKLMTSNDSKDILHAENIGAAAAVDAVPETTAEDEKPKELSVNDVESMMIQVPSADRQMSFTESIKSHSMNYTSHAEQRSLMAAPPPAHSRMTADEVLRNSHIEWRAEALDQSDDETEVQKIDQPSNLWESENDSQVCALGESEGDWKPTTTGTSQTLRTEAQAEELTAVPSISASAEQKDHSCTESLSDNEGKTETDCIALYREGSRNERSALDKVQLACKVAHIGPCNAFTDQHSDETKVMMTADQEYPERQPSLHDEHNTRRHIRAEIHFCYGTSVWERIKDLYHNYNG